MHTSILSTVHAHIHICTHTHESINESLSKFVFMKQQVITLFLVFIHCSCCIIQFIMLANPFVCLC